MKKSGFAKGVIWTLSIGIVLVVILATIGVVAYKGYTNAALEASYSRGNTETTIKIEKKDKLSSEIASVDKIKLKKDDKNYVSKTIIETGRNNGDFIEVLKGVSIGDEIVSEGARKITNNSEVKIINN